MSVEEAIGSLKAHEERLRRQTESSRGQQLLLTEEEWMKKESNEGQLLLTREEWMRRSNRTGVTDVYQSSKFRGKEGIRGGCDRSKVKCWKCNIYGHYSTEYRKPRRDRETKPEVNIA